jgi:hypothetical protein
MLIKITSAITAATKYKKIAEHRGEDIKHSKFHMGTPFGLMA